MGHNDVIKWKHFPRYWPFVRGIHRSPVNSPHKGQWRVALMFSLICGWINRWINNREAGDLKRHLVHYDVIVMMWNLIDYIKLTSCYARKYLRLTLQLIYSYHGYLKHRHRFYCNVHIQIWMLSTRLYRLVYDAKYQHSYDGLPNSKYLWFTCKIKCKYILLS